MALRTRAGSKKKKPTKYSAIGATAVPLSQSMKSKSPRMTTSPQKTNSPSNDSFFDDDFWGDSQPSNSKNKSRNTTNDGLGLHKTNDVSSSSPSLSFTPTPPPKSNRIKLKTSHSKSNTPKTDRSVFYLGSLDAKDTKKSIAKSKQNKLITSPQGNGAQIQEKNPPPNRNSNYISNLFDNIMPLSTTKNTTKNTTNNANKTSTSNNNVTQNGQNKDVNIQLKEEDVEDVDVETNEKIKNDPNYLPPPEENTTPSSTKGNNDDTEEDDTDFEDEDVPPTPGKNELNPWAHLNKVVTSITEAPIDQDDDHENRGFLRHDADDGFGGDTPTGYTYSPKNGNDNGQTSVFRRCCWCLTFIIGIAIGVLLAIELIRHQAIDANYLFGPTSTETESDSIIETEIGDSNYNPLFDRFDKRNNSQDRKEIIDRHRIDSYDDQYESTIDTDIDINTIDILGPIQGREDKRVTESPTMSPSVTSKYIQTKEPIVITAKPTDNPTEKKTTSLPTKLITNPPTKPPTKAKVITDSPTKNPTQKPITDEPTSTTTTTTKKPTESVIRKTQQLLNMQTPSPTQLLPSNAQNNVNDQDVTTETTIVSNPSQSTSLPPNTVVSDNKVDDDEMVQTNINNAQNEDSNVNIQTNKVQTKSPSIGSTSAPPTNDINNVIPANQGLHEQIHVSNTDEPKQQQNNDNTNPNEATDLIANIPQKQNDVAISEQQTSTVIPSDENNDQNEETNPAQPITTSNSDEITDNPQSIPSDNIDSNNNEGITLDNNTDETYSDEGQENQEGIKQPIKTTASPTDYHHVYEGIAMANKLKQQQNISNTDIINKPNNQQDAVVDTSSHLHPSSPYPTPLPVSSPSTNLTDTQQQSDSETVKNTVMVTKSPATSPSVTSEPLNSNQQTQQKEETTKSPTLYPTPQPIKIDPPPPPIIEESDSSEDDPSSTLLNVDPLCNVVAKNQCGGKKDNLPLPIPFDKPLSAQLRCHTNTCTSPPNLPGQRFITGQTFEAGKTVLDITNPISTQCHNHFHTINVKRDGYDNNEDWKWCLRISNDNSLGHFPRLHVTFSMIDFDLEQGFDNLFFTTQFDDEYDDYSEVWSGTWDTLHRFEPNTWYQNFWTTSSKPNSFAEFCLRLQSDESNTGKGFTGRFKITQEIGQWSEWSDCYTTCNLGNIANNACGVGVHSRVSLCPQSIIPPNTMDDKGRFDWSNGTHSCINKYSNYPLNKYCIVRDCNDIDNEKYAPDKVKQQHKSAGDWDGWRDYIYNGVSRIDPIYPDPFQIHPNVINDVIYIDQLKENLQSEIDKIYSRYPKKSQELFPKILLYQYPIHFDKLGVRLLSSLILGRVFTFVTTGSSNTAGHDNVFMSSYPMQLQSLMQVIWNKYAIYGGAFRVRNQAIGGHLGTHKQGPCINAIIGTYDKNIDMVAWESFMNDGSRIPPEFEEIWVRNILNTYGVENEHSQPFMTCISTADTDQAGCKLTGRYVMNSFIANYYNATGVGNFYGQHVCRVDAICEPHEDPETGHNTTKGCFKDDAFEACRAPHVSWHPSPHRHRVMAETFAVNFMLATINAIDRLYDKINNILSKSKHTPNYELACLLEDYLGEIHDEYGVISTVDNNHAVFQRPLNEPKTKCKEKDICHDKMWCAISFWPTPKHNQLHRYFVDNDGFYNNDTIDLPVHPLIMRNGGRESIDHKAQWDVDRHRVGSYLEIKVKVPKRYIMIVYPQGTSKVHTAIFLDAFEITVDGEIKKCDNVPYGGGEWEAQFCLLDAEKPGKYSLKLTLVNDTNDLVDRNKYKFYSIDEVVGV